MLRFLTAGESHGQALTAIIEGMPAGLTLRREHIETELKRRQKGYGRGGRMKIESDTVRILAGVRFERTLGSPIALLIENRDWRNWSAAMSVDESAEDQPVVTKPRPGHADLAGAMKYGHGDIRNVLERASARETAVRVAVGAVAKRLLGEHGMQVVSHVLRVGKATAAGQDVTNEQILNRAEASPVRCVDASAEKKMIAAIDEAAGNGDSLGGVCEIRALGCPVGLGSYVHWDRRLDGRLSSALMSIPGVKGVEIGLGFEAAALTGSQVQDEIGHDGRDFIRSTNNAGGIEGGVSNGQDIVLRVAMKPVPTLGQPLRTVDVITKEPTEALKERADVCVVPALGVIGEAVVAIEIAVACQEKFGGDSLEEMMRNYRAYLEQMGRFSAP